MRLCFEFLGSTTAKPRRIELMDFGTMMALCDERRANGQKGFLVRADTQDEALSKRATAPQTPNEYYIL